MSHKERRDMAMPRIFRTYRQHQPTFLPQSSEELIPEKHLVRIVSQAIDETDLSALEQSFRGGGAHEAVANGTVFVVGEIVEINIPDGTIGEDGYVDIEEAGTIAVSGLDGYHETRRIARLSYARPGVEPKELQ
jgi:hypothetical protein